MPAAPPEPGREMLIEVVGLHAQALLRMPWVQTGLVLGLWLFLFPYLGFRGFLCWAALSVGMEILRARYARHVLKHAQRLDPRHTHATFIALAAGAGASIGAGAMLFLPQLPILHQALYGATLFAIPAAGIAVSQSSRNILAAYALCLLLPASATWSYLHRSQAVGLAALTLLYCVVIILVAADGEKLLLRSVTIRHQRDRLVRDLEQRNADVRIAMTQAEQSAKARARVLAAASHDLRQPLHALSVYSAVLASRPAPDLLNEVSGNIDQIVRSLGHLLNGLLDLSRLSTGNYVPEHENFALEELVGTVCAEFGQAAAQKSLRLVTELSPVRVIGDSVAISRIVRNLLDNAVKYTPSGEVRVATRTELLGRSPLAVIGVSDTGKGIPAGEHARIFEEFYQLDNPGRERSQGVGLGLAIVQRLCELTGAKIQLRSAEGEGTTFTVSMPAAPAVVDAQTAGSVGVPPVSLEGRRIYVVDDERDIRNSMRTLLGVWGVDGRTASSVLEAEELFAVHGAPDLLIVDLRLGGSEHGADLADRLRERHAPPCGVLIITGETASEALSAATARYLVLQKPIAAELLRRAIVQALPP